MKVFAIGDLHLSGQPPMKPMDVFGPHWDRHWERIQEDWQRQVSPEDLVFLVGDTSWFLKLSDAAEDLAAIDALPGKKILIRGNHDYWWASVNKMDGLGFGSLQFLQGHGTAIGNLAFGGTRAYLCPDDGAFEEETDRSIYNRELLRVEAALKEMIAAGVANGFREEELIKVLLVHYPPFNDKNEPSGFTELMEKYGVQHCIFGHLHDTMSFKRIPDTFGDTVLHLVSADYNEFTLKALPFTVRGV